MGHGFHSCVTNYRNYQRIQFQSNYFGGGPIPRRRPTSSHFLGPQLFPTCGDFAAAKSQVRCTGGGTVDGIPLHSRHMTLGRTQPRYPEKDHGSAIHL